MKHYQTSKNSYEFFQHINLYHHINSAQLQMFTKTWLDPFLSNHIELLPTPDKLSKFQKKSLQTNVINKQSNQIVSPHSQQKKSSVKSFPPAHELTLNLETPESLNLKNGLKIYLQEKKHLPLFSFQFLFKQSFYFKSSLEGLSMKLMMNMLMEQSRYYSKVNNITFFEQYGTQATFSAFGGTVHGLNYSIDPVIKRFLYILKKPKFTQHVLNKWKKGFEATINRLSKNNTAWGLRALKSIIFSGHPYGWDYDEALSHVQHLTLNDLYKIHATYVNPTNVSFSLVGNFNKNEIKKTLTELLESWEQKEEKMISLPQQSFIPASKIDKKTQHNNVALMFGQPCQLSIDHQDKLILTLLNFVCFKSLGSRLYELREQHGLFYSATGRWAHRAIMNDGYNFIQTTVSPQNVERAEHNIHQLISKIAQEGITQDELDAAKQWYRKKIIDRFSKNKTLSTTWCNLSNLKLPLDHFEKNLRRIKSLQLQDINRLCKKYFQTHQMARVRVGNIHNTEE